MSKETRPLIRAEKRFVDAINALVEWFSQAEEYSIKGTTDIEDDKIIIHIEVTR